MSVMEEGDCMSMHACVHASVWTCACTSLPLSLMLACMHVRVCTYVCACVCEVGEGGSDSTPAECCTLSLSLAKETGDRLVFWLRTKSELTKCASGHFFKSPPPPLPPSSMENGGHFLDYPGFFFFGVLHCHGKNLNFLHVYTTTGKHLTFHAQVALLLWLLSTFSMFTPQKVNT